MSLVKHPLDQLRTAAQKILMLTDGCETLAQAAHRLHQQVDCTHAHTDPDAHQHATLGLESLNVTIHHGMTMMIDLYNEAGNTDDY
jgi:hypothetical protein